LFHFFLARQHNGTVNEVFPNRFVTARNFGVHVNDTTQVFFINGLF